MQQQQELVNAQTELEATKIELRKLNELLTEERAKSLSGILFLNRFLLNFTHSFVDIRATIRKSTVESQDREDKLKAELAEAKKELSKSGNTFVLFCACFFAHCNFFFFSQYSETAREGTNKTKRPIKCIVTYLLLPPLILPFFNIKETTNASIQTLEEQIAVKDEMLMSLRRERKILLVSFFLCVSLSFLLVYVYHRAL